MADIMLNSIYGRNDILSVAVADLALPKIGLDSLVLMASTDISFKADFLNRVGLLLHNCNYNALQLHFHTTLGAHEHHTGFPNILTHRLHDVSLQTGALLQTM